MRLVSAASDRGEASTGVLVLVISTLVILAAGIAFAISDHASQPDYSAATITVHNAHWRLRSPGLTLNGDTISGEASFGTCSVKLTASIKKPSDVTAYFPSGVVRKVSDVTFQQARIQAAELGLTNC